MNHLWEWYDHWGQVETGQELVVRVISAGLEDGRVKMKLSVKGTGAQPEPLEFGVELMERLPSSDLSLSEVLESLPGSKVPRDEVV